LSEEAQELVNLINEEFNTEGSTAISDGRSPLKTKEIDITL